MEELGAESTVYTLAILEEYIESTDCYQRTEVPHFTLHVSLKRVLSSPERLLPGSMFLLTNPRAILHCLC